MSRPPNRYRPTDPREVAEQAFKSATTKPVAPLPVVSAASPPNARELVSIRIDRDVLDHFQKDGPGWQERINAALRLTMGK